MTHDLDLKVAQVGRKSIKFQTNIYKHAKYQLDPSTCSRDIDLTTLTKNLNKKFLNL